MKRALRFLRKLVFWTFFVGLFFLTTITVILHIYEDDIKRFAIDEINSHLKTKMEVRNIELSIFHDFPRASLEFEHVLIKDAFANQQSDDTMFFAKRVYCTFNVWDIWNGDYNVKRVATEDAKLNLRTTLDGDVNYDIIKDSEDTTQTKFKFAIELLRIDRLNFLYANSATGQYYKVDVEKGLIQGNFTENEYQIVSESQLVIHQIKSNSLSLINNKSATLDLKLNVNNAARSYEFEQGDLTVGEMPFKITGIIDSVEMDLAISGERIEVAQLANSLAAGTMPDAQRYNGTGVLGFNASIKGSMSSLVMPSVTATFNVTDGTLTEPVSNLKIFDLQINGDYQNAQDGSDEMLSFSRLNFKLLNSFFAAKGSVINFAQPKITALIKGSLELDAFHTFFRFPNVEKIEGKVDLNLDFIAQFHDPEYRKDKFSILKSTGNLSLKNVLYKHKDNDLTYQRINGEVVVNNNDAAVKNLAVKTNKSDFVLNGAMHNLMKYVEGSGSLGVIATLESSAIDLNEFIGEGNTQKETTLVKFELPQNLNLNIDVAIKKLVWQEHENNSVTGKKMVWDHQYTNISGKLLMANRKATASNFRLSMLGGQVAGSLVLNNLGDAGNVIDGELAFSGVNIKSIFAEWDNFKQETITDKNLSGTGSGTLDLLLFFNPYFSIIEDKIYALLKIDIENGQLNDVQTMKLVTDYMRSNKALKLLLNKHIDKFEDKLMHLSFSKLSNQIKIQDRRIIIPKMKIITNALDVDLWGWHDFDNNVEYHFSFRFRDLKTIPEYTEFGKVEDDGLGLIIYLTMTGSIDDPQFALDKQERKNDVKENIEEEKQTVKSILKTEFGLFKKDTTVQQMKDKNKKQVEFIFYDEDVEDTDTTKVKRNKGRAGKLFDKMKEDADKKQQEFEFGEDL